MFDLSLARTFLEVVATGSFTGAAMRLNCTQSTVSARVRLLEETLGQELFVRNKGGAALTAAGQQFQKHAAQLLRTWEQACQEVSVPSGYTSLLRIGAEPGLWMRLLHPWIRRMRQNHPQTAIKVMSGGPEELVHSLVEGSLDFAILYTPQSRPGLQIELLAEEELILVQSRGVKEHPQFDGKLGRGYIYVEWSHEFALSHRAAFPDSEHPGLVIDMGMLAYQHLLEAGGSGYFPSSLIGEMLAAGKLERCVGAPTFTLPIYAMYPPNIETERLDAIKSELHSVLSS